eukprot:tig00000339_g24180.t1
MSPGPLLLRGSANPGAARVNYEGESFYLALQRDELKLPASGNIDREERRKFVYDFLGRHGGYPPARTHEVCACAMLRLFITI